MKEYASTSENRSAVCLGAHHATVLGLLFLLPTLASAGEEKSPSERHRVLVSTDLGGTDPDDIQSVIHLLVYSDVLDVVGIISSPYGPGRKADILKVIDAYEQDFSQLRVHSHSYPAPDSLRSICKQGATSRSDETGWGKPTEGSRWIASCARRKGSRPLHLLVWGGIEDLAQALHDEPDILPKLRVFWIGGPNKKWSVDAYNYIEQQHPNLWMIESNSTYRGWFVGGEQSGEWSNDTFVEKHIAGHGALGDLFVAAKADLKMGDSPSVGRLLYGDSEDPSQPSWGGKYVPIWSSRKTVFHRLTTESDKSEVFGVTEFVFPKPNDFSSRHSASMVFSNSQPPSQGVVEGDVLRFRFSPRDAKTWSYKIQSDFAGLNGRTGQFRAVPPTRETTRNVSSRHPNWWIDDQTPAAAEGIHPGARSVNKWREDFLRGFANRMDRCL